MATAGSRARYLTVALAAILPGLAAAQAPQAPVATDPTVPAPQAATPVRAFVFQPELRLSESYSDNVALAIDSLARSGWVTDLSAGARAQVNGPRLTGDLNFRVNRILHDEDSTLNNTQRRLNSRARLEAVDRWLYIDTRADISQQNRNALGSGNLLEGPNTARNRVETTHWQVSPYVQGVVSDRALYQLRWNTVDTSTRDDAVPSTRTAEWTGFVKNTPASGALGWSVDGNALLVTNATIGEREQARLRGTVTAAFGGQFTVSGSAGYERSNFASINREGEATYGGAITWAPSTRTQMVGAIQKRFFGNDYLVGISHRMPRTAFTLASGRELAVVGNELTSTAPGSVYALLLDLLAASIPDPVARSAAVQRRLARSEQAEAPTTVAEDYLTARPFVVRRDQGSVALLGTRNTITLSFGRTQRKGFDDAGLDPQLAQREDVKQRGYNLSWSYRLTRVTNLRLLLSRQHAEALNFEAESTQQQQSLFLTSQFGPRFNGTLGVRRVKFESTIEPGYTENAVVGTLTLQF